MAFLCELLHAWTWAVRALEGFCADGVSALDPESQPYHPWDQDLRVGSAGPLCSLADQTYDPLRGLWFLNKRC